MKKTKTLLAIGDIRDFDTFKKVYNQRKFFSKSSIQFKSMSYDSLLKEEFPKASTKEIIFFLFFPFEYWDKHIEPKDYAGVYGNKSFYIKFKKFWKIVDKKINKNFKNRKIKYVNPPQALAIDRDKELTKRLVSKADVLVPRNYKTRKFDKIVSLLDNNKKLFIKVNFGSMGKGITFLEKGRWMTNFRFKKGKIVSKKSDYGWTFVNVTGKKDFLQELLKKDIIIEDAIDPYLVNNRKFDFRMYVYGKKILYCYGRSNSLESITTNISQGAQGEKPSFFKKIPKKQYEFIQNQAACAIKALGLKFGGVDIMPCSDGKTSKFIEINTFPGLPKVKRFNLSKFLIQEIIKDYK